MYVKPLLVTEFKLLTEPLMMSSLDLPRSVQRLEDTAISAVRSLLGWSLSLSVDGANVTLTSMQPRVVPADVRASLRIPFSAFLTVGLDGGLVFYGGAPHAFFRLADSFIPAFGPSPCRIDEDLNPSLTLGLSGVRKMKTINRAAGVLISHGGNPDRP